MSQYLPSPDPSKFKDLASRQSALIAACLDEIESKRVELVELIRERSLSSRISERVSLSYVQAFASTKYRPSWVNGSKSRVFYDIETDKLRPGESTRQYFENIVNHQMLGAVSISNTGEVKYWTDPSALVEYLISFDEIVSYYGVPFDNVVLASTTSPEKAQELFNKSFDMCWYFRQAEYVEESETFDNKLDTVSRHFLGKGKLERVEKVWELYENDRPKFWKYCQQDVELLFDLYALFQPSDSVKLRTIIPILNFCISKVTLQDRSREDGIRRIFRDSERKVTKKIETLCKQGEKKGIKAAQDAISAFALDKLIRFSYDFAQKFSRYTYTYLAPNNKSLRDVIESLLVVQKIRMLLPYIPIDLLIRTNIALAYEPHVISTNAVLFSKGRSRIFTIHTNLTPSDLKKAQGWATKIFYIRITEQSEKMGIRSFFGDHPPIMLELSALINAGLVIVEPENPEPLKFDEEWDRLVKKMEIASTTYRDENWHKLSGNIQELRESLRDASAECLRVGLTEKDSLYLDIQDKLIWCDHIESGNQGKKFVRQCDRELE